MDFDFTKAMQEVSDVELVRILTLERDNYQEPAILAAEQEFARRNLSTEQVEQAKTEIAVAQNIKEARAKAPLDLHWKVLSVMFPGLFQLIISGLLKGEGFDRKSRELTKWTLIGLAFYITLIVLAT